MRVGLRARVLTATVLPAILVALALAAILLDRQYRGLDEAMQARARADARQLASAAEFGIFAGSSEALKALVRATQSGDADILGVAIFDSRGLALATTGTMTLGPPGPSWDEQVFQRGDATVVVVPISRSRLPVDDIYSGSLPQATGPIDGYVVLEISRRNLDLERNRQLAIGVGIALVGSLLAAWLALGIASGVIRPILHIGDVVDRIGRGELTARVVPDPANVMPGLEAGINDMAQRIGLTQENLKQQIDAATAELRQRSEEAELAVAAKTRFVAAASHDLRQPLHALGLFVSRLTQLQHAPEVRPLVGNIDASVQALQDLLETLLDISRLDAGLVEAKPTDFALADLFERLDLDYAGSAAEKAVKLRIRPTPVWLHTDPRLLMRILMNLVSNALRYTARGGVLVACRPHGETATIEIWDTGIGIPPEHLHDIFSEYVQIGNPERHHAKGLGLGLAICDRLAQLLGLSIGVRSVPGRGTVFRIDIPRGRPGVAAAPEVPEVLASGRIEGVVAVIENRTDNATGINGLIAGWGCQVIAGATASEAMTRCLDAGVKPDLVITAYRLGGDDGISAGLAMRRNYGQIPVILISADSDERLVAGAAHRRFVLLTKPVRPGKLRAIVQQLLAEKRAAPVAAGSDA